MKKSIEYLVIAICVIISVSLALKFRTSYKVLKNERESLTLEINDIKAKYSYLNKIYLNCKVLISNDILKEISSNNSGNTLIGFFNEYNCGYCVKEMVIELEKFSSSKNFSNIHLISNVKSDEDFYKPFGGKKIDDFPYTYIDNSKELSNTFSISPVILVINTSGDIIHIYVPELQKEYNEIYFNEILPKILL